MVIVQRQYKAKEVFVGGKQLWDGAAGGREEDKG